MRSRLLSTGIPPDKICLQNDRLIIKVTDDLLIGRLQLQEVSENVIRTTSSMAFTADYAGVTLLNDHYQPVATLKRIHQGMITLKDEFSRNSLRTGEVMRICNVALGDEIVVKSLFNWTEQ